MHGQQHIKLLQYIDKGGIFMYF